MKLLRIHARGFLATSAILTIWTILAIRSPDLTYHFAPLLAAAAWPFLVRRHDPPPVRDALTAAVGAFVVTAVTASVLAGAHYLEGPTFWNDGPALTEALLFAALGSTVGIAFALRPSPVSAA